MMIIPAIDLRGGSCVRLRQGLKEEQTVYGTNAIDTAVSFQKQGAQMLHVVDLDGAFSDPNSRNRDVLGQILRAVTIPVQFGGGLRSRQDVETVLALGVTQVVVGTLAVEAPNIVQSLVSLFPGRICAGIDAREGKVVTRGWEKQESVAAHELAQHVAAIGIERIVYTDVTRDGMLQGINLDQTLLIARESGLKITASGGVSSLDDLKRLSRLAQYGVDSVIVGKALYEGRFTLREALIK